MHQNILSLSPCFIFNVSLELLAVGGSLKRVLVLRCLSQREQRQKVRDRMRGDPSFLIMNASIKNTSWRGYTLALSKFFNSSVTSFSHGNNN